MGKIFSAIGGSAYGGKNKKGFSLLELITVIAIIGIMASVSIVSLQNSKTEKELETAALGVEAVIREAQNNALAGKGASSANGCTKYDFTYTGGSSDYSVGTVSGSGCPFTPYTLKNGITFSSSGSFSFNIPFGTLDPSGDYSIALTKSSKCYNVNVAKSGSVTTQKANCP